MGGPDVFTGGVGVTLGEVRVAAGFDVGPCAVTAAEFVDAAVPAVGVVMLRGGAASATPPNTTTRTTEAAGNALENRTTSLKRWRASFLTPPKRPGSTTAVNSAD